MERLPSAGQSSALFFGIVAVGIVLIGYLFNAFAYLFICKRSINHVRQDKVCFQEAGAGLQFHGSSAS